MSITIGKSRNTIPAVRSLVKGDEIAYWDYGGGESTLIEGQIVDDYYTERGGNHIFKISLVSCSSGNAKEILAEARLADGIITRMAKKLYPFGVHRKESQDNKKRDQLKQEKNMRSNSSKKIVLIKQAIRSYLNIIKP